MTHNHHRPPTTLRFLVVRLVREEKTQLAESRQMFHTVSSLRLQQEKLLCALTAGDLFDSGRILKARFRVSRPDRGKCSLLWNSGQSGRTPSWMQAFTGPFQDRVREAVR